MRKVVIRNFAKLIEKLVAVVAGKQHGVLIYGMLTSQKTQL